MILKSIKNLFSKKILLPSLIPIALKYLLFFVYLIFEQLVINIAKKLLNFIRKFNVYERFITYICQNNDFILMSSFLLIGVIAEASATLAVFLLAKNFVKLGILFYILKIIIYIPAVDIFKRNKKRLLRYKIIRVVFYWYLLIIKSKIYKTLKKIIKKYKVEISRFFYTIKHFLQKKEIG